MSDTEYAFPRERINAPSKGMTLRDYFAAKALQGVLASGDYNRADAVPAAYVIADAMMKARND